MIELTKREHSQMIKAINQSRCMGNEADAAALCAVYLSVKEDIGTGVASKGLTVTVKWLDTAVRGMLPCRVFWFAMGQGA